MKHRNFGKFLIAAASISMAVSPITALANETAPVVFSADEAQVDKTMLLDEAVTYAEAQKADANYEKVVKKVKDNFEAKLDAAKAKQSSTDAAEINKAWSDLVDAIHYLSFTGDHAGLTAALDTAAALNEDEYTADSWKVLDDAVKAGTTLNADEDALDAELEAAVTAINAAIEALDKKGETPDPEVVDKAALEAAIAEAKAKNAEDYTEESFAAVTEALAAAEAVAKDENATQDEVDNAKKALNAAVAALVEKGETPDPDKADKTALKEAIKSYDVTAAANDADEDDSTKIYLTEDSRKAYDEAAEAAKAVDAKEDATQDEVDKAVAALEAAKADLAQVIWRVYNENNGEHLFTVNQKEYNFLSNNGWNGEGAAWIAPFDGRGMTRMYDSNSGEHHYTSNAKEANYLESIGWTNEGVKWFSDSKEDGIVIHRLYNPNETRAGRHHYTLADKEKNYLADNGWNWEHEEADLIYAKAEAPKAE